MRSLETKIHSLIIKPQGEPIFSEQATIVGIEDEAAGVFFTISQDRCGDMGHISLDAEEWIIVKAAIDRLAEEWSE